MKYVMSFLKLCPCLRSLTVTEAGWKPAFVPLIAPFLQGLPTLKSLNITCNGAVEVKELTRILPSLGFLEEFIYQSSKNGGLDPLLVKDMLEQVPGTVRSLGFYIMEEHPSLVHVADVLAKNRLPLLEKLLLLNLGHHDKKGRRELGRSLRIPSVAKKLKTLYLSSGGGEGRQNFNWEDIEPILNIDPNAEPDDSVLPSLECLIISWFGEWHILGTALHKGWLPKLSEVRQKETEDLSYQYPPLDELDELERNDFFWYTYNVETTMLWFEVMRARKLRTLNGSVSIPDDEPAENLQALLEGLSGLEDPTLTCRLLELDLEYCLLEEFMCGDLARAITSTNLRSLRSLSLRLADHPLEEPVADEAEKEGTTGHFDLGQALSHAFLPCLRSLALAVTALLYAHRKIVQKKELFSTAFDYFFKGMASVTGEPCSLDTLRFGLSEHYALVDELAFPWSIPQSLIRQNLAIALSSVRHLVLSGFQYKHLSLMKRLLDCDYFRGIHRLTIQGRRP